MNTFTVEVFGSKGWEIVFESESLREAINAFERRVLDYVPVRLQTPIRWEMMVDA